MLEKDSDMMDSDKLIVSFDYPHSLLRHIRKLQGDGELSSILHEDFFEKFCNEYEDFQGEVEELRVAYEIDLLYEFYEKRNISSWLKRAFIAKTLYILVKKLRERDAVELIESLMFIFNWRFSMEIERKWEVDEEDKARYHEADATKYMGGEFERRAKVLSDKIQDRERTSNRNSHNREERSHGRRDISKADARKGDRGASASGNAKDSSHSKGEKRRQSRSDGRMKSTDERDNQSSVSGEGSEKSKLSEFFLESEETKPTSKQEVKFMKLMPVSLRREIKPAERGNSASQRHLGDFYADEESEHLDYKEAARWYRYAANQGDYRSLLELGRLLDGRKLSDTEDEDVMKAEGIRYFRRLAEKGYPTAQCILGLKYYFGDYVEEDLSEAAKWLRMSAVQGNVDAQRALGNLYNRLGNTGEAKKWYQKAAAFGDLYSKEQISRI